MAATVGRSANISTTHFNRDRARCAGNRTHGKTVRTERASTGTWHVLTMEFEPTALRFFLDGDHYGTNDITGQLFEERPLFMVINYAVGGNLGGP